ncbi:MAG: GGDEF domain-containing protein [Spirochaetaceae bacterium]|nr:GGDEF domain-containing protein [Spirochaetaceae bacterium]
MHINSKWRLIGILSLILLTAFSAIILIDFISTRNSMKVEIVRSSLPLLQENIYSTILSDLLPSMNTASMMANDSFLVNWEEGEGGDISEITEYLNRIQKKYGFNSVFFVSESSKRYYYPDGINKIISPLNDHDIWYFNFLDTGKEFELDVDTDETAGDRLTIFINYRLENSEGELLGVTGVGVEKKGFSEFLSLQQDLFGKMIFLVDSQGVIQAHSDLESVEQADIHEIDGLKSVADKILSSRMDPYTGMYNSDGKKIVLMSRYIPEIDWFVVVEYDENEAMSGIQRRMAQSLVISLLAFALILLFSILTVNRYDSRMETMAITDALTGVANRRALDAALPRMLYRRSRQEGNVSLILIDLDHFKTVNDKFGHLVGDEVLKSFSRTASREIRQDDLLVRWGGDEFLIVSESGIEGALRVADEIRKRHAGIESRVTLSMGIAVADDNDIPESLLKKADQALYEAKEGGRDKTVVLRAGEVTQKE